jgi:hypothetical protein
MHGISCSSMEWNLFGSCVYYLIFYIRFGIRWKVHMKVNSYCTRCVEEMSDWIECRVRIAEQESHLIICLEFRSLRSNKHSERHLAASFGEKVGHILWETECSERRLTGFARSFWERLTNIITKTKNFLA